MRHSTPLPHRGWEGVPLNANAASRHSPWGPIPDFIQLLHAWRKPVWPLPSLHSCLNSSSSLFQSPCQRSFNLSAAWTLFRIQTWHIASTIINHISSKLGSYLERNKNHPSWSIMLLHSTWMHASEIKTLLRGAYHRTKSQSKMIEESQLNLQLHPDQEINDIIISKLKTDQGLSIDLNHNRSPMLLTESMGLGEFRKGLSWW